MKNFNIEDYWKAIAKQSDKDLIYFFHPQAVINWHNTNESFTVQEFIEANCKYPGKWIENIQKIHALENLLICVVQITSDFNIHDSNQEKLSFHVTSFIKIFDNKIIQIDEYWGKDGKAPQWRKNMNIGREIINN